jgi:hypothetical protein
LQPQNKQSIEKIAACITLIILLQRNRCKVNIQDLSKKKITLDINIGTSKKHFPYILLDGAIKKIENAFGISIDYSLYFEKVVSDSHNINVPLIRMRDNKK